MQPKAPQLGVDALYSGALSLRDKVEYQLQELESAGGSMGSLESGGGAVTPAVLTETLNQFCGEVVRLERLLEEGALKEATWRTRIESLAAEARGQRRSVERFLRVTHAAREEARDRGLLFAGAAQRAEAVAVDSFLKERSSLLSSNAMMDEVAQAAESVMGALKDQRTVLKGAHKRVLDIATSLGVSNSLMKIIERRTVGDRVLVYGGSAFIVLLLVAVWWFR